MAPTRQTNLISYEFLLHATHQAVAQVFWKQLAEEQPCQERCCWEKPSPSWPVATLPLRQQHARDGSAITATFLVCLSPPLGCQGWFRGLTGGFIMGGSPSLPPSDKREFVPPIKSNLLFVMCYFQTSHSFTEKSGVCEG